VSLLSLRAGSLRLQSLDLIVPEAESPSTDRLAAISIAPGAELTAVDCTVTLATGRPTATAIVVHPPSVAPGRRLRAADVGSAAVVEFRDGMIRSGGAAFSVAGGSRFELNLHDAMVAADGSLLQVAGSVRDPGGSARGPSVTLRLDRVTARVKGGLVHLRTSPEEPEMAAVDIRAARSILSTVTGDHPLLRLEGRDRLEAMRDKIRWEGHNVAYHRVKMYRRDEVVEAGDLPMIYGRDDWTRAFRPTDESPTLADLQFVRQADAAKPAWKLSRDVLRVAPNGAAAGLGPDVDKVPEPPAEEES
jgi:serine/threonine-protein kinase